MPKPTNAAAQSPIPSGPSSELIGVRGLPLGYFNMPKAGCTTIKNILYFLEKGEWLDLPLEIHRVISRQQGLLLNTSFQQQRLEMETRSPYFTFTFVRHPGRRVYSAFVEKILTCHEYSFMGIQRHLINKMEFTHRRKRIESLDDMPPVEEIEIDDMRSNFRKFLKFVQNNLSRKTRFHPNAHWVVQAERIDKLSSQDQLDFIGRIESFENDFNHVMKTVGINQPELSKKRFNEGPKPPISYEELLGPVLKKMIRELYAKDFERFGYSDL